MNAPPTRDWFWLELAALVAILVAGAGLRYWLSTATPFDAAEMAALLEANVPGRHLRVPFVMINGASLFLLYLVARRSAGVVPAFTLLLLLQTSLAFQQLAFRIRFSAGLLLLLLVAGAYVRFLYLPPGRRRRRLNRPLLGVCVLLALKGLVLVVTLPQRLDALRRETAADPAAILAQLDVHGVGAVTSLERLRSCQLAWPVQRSLDQQETLLDHRQRLGPRAALIASAADLHAQSDPRSAVFDPGAVVFFALPDGPLVAQARRVAGLP